MTLARIRVRIAVRWYQAANGAAFGATRPVNQAACVECRAHVTFSATLHFPESESEYVRVV